LGAPDFTAVEAVQIVIWIHALSVTVAGLEYIHAGSDFGSTGAFAWKVFRTTRDTLRIPRNLDRVHWTVFGRRGSVAVIATQVVAVLAAAALPVRTWVQWIALLVSCVGLGLLAWRQRYGEDGADQMNLIVAVTLVLTVGPFQSMTALQLGLAFLAAQLALSYLSAGVAKLISPVWRSGAAVGLVLNTASYGSRPAGALLKRLPWAGRLLTWSVVAFEISFPVALVLPWPWVAVPMAIGAFFHASIAIVMGLNNFVPAFLSTYPALLYTSMFITGSNLPS
jgi:hypothetical protein